MTRNPQLVTRNSQLATLLSRGFLMPRTQIAVGIDIGAHALKAVALRKSGNHVALVRAATLELGEMAFIDDSERKDLRIAELLHHLLRRARIRSRTACAGLAGRDYFVKYLHVPPTTPDKLRKLIEYEVLEDPTAAVQDQTTDFWLLDLPTKAEEFTVLVVMSRNDTLRRRLSLLRRAGAVPEGLTLDAIGLFNAYVNALDEAVYNDKTTLLVDIGAQHMDIVVQRNAKLLFVRNLTLGGNRFTEAVQEEFHLPIGEAEELKIAQGAILPRHFDVAAEIDTATPEARLSAALLEPAETIYDTLQATIKYCQTQTRMTNLKIDEVVLSGRCARLRGLREFLARRFRTPVEILDPLRGIDTSPLGPAERGEVVENANSYTVAIGLALRELEERQVRPITLLPESVRRRREFITHTFFLYLAAAVFALAFGVMVYSSSIATARTLQEAKIEAGLIHDAEGLHTQLKTHMGRNAVLAGQAESLKHVLDTARRSAEVLVVLKETVAPQLRIDAVSASTERSALFVVRGGRGGPEGPEADTHLLIEGRVASKFAGQPIGEGAAKTLVDDFLARLLEQKHIYKEAKVTKYPAAAEPSGQRTFKIDVTFAIPFQGE